MKEETLSTPEPRRDALDQMIGPRVQELERMIGEPPGPNQRAAWLTGETTAGRFDSSDW